MVSLLSLSLPLLLLLFFFPSSSFSAPETCPFSLGPLSFQLCFNDYGYGLGRCPSTPFPTSLNGASILIIAGSNPVPLKYTCTTDCAITCIGEEACKDLELTCSGNCAIHCEGSGDRVCQDLKINNTGNLVIDCQGSGKEACSGIKFEKAEGSNYVLCGGSGRTKRTTPGKDRCKGIDYSACNGACELSCFTECFNLKYPAIPGINSTKLYYTNRAMNYNPGMLWDNPPDILCNGTGPCQTKFGCGISSGSVIGLSPPPTPIPSNSRSRGPSRIPSRSSSISSLPSTTTSRSRSRTKKPTETPKDTPIPVHNTPTPTPSIITCTTGKSCDEEKTNPPCTDMNNPKCEGALEDCHKHPNSKDCVPEEDEIIVKIPEDKDDEETYHVTTPDGGVLAEVEVDPTKFPKGTTIKIKYIGGDQSEDLKKDKSGGCSASSSLLSYGTVEITAYDKDGKEIKNLDGEGIGVGFNIPGNSIDENNICVGSTDSSKSNWECDPGSTQTDKKGKVGKVKRRFNHLTSFAVFIGTNGGCGTLWIAAVSCIVAVPIVLAFLAFGIARTKWGRKVLYGFKGKTLEQTITRVSTVQNLRQSTITRVDSPRT